MNRRLKILFLTNRNPYPARDGQSRRTYSILLRLAKMHDVHLLSLYEKPDEVEQGKIEHLKGLCKYVEMIPAPPKKVSIQMVIRLAGSVFSIYPYTIWRHYSRQFVKRLNEIMRQNDYDIVHCDILPIAYVVKGIKGTPVALTDHDVSYLKTLSMVRNCRNIPLKLFLYYEAFKLKIFESKIFSQVDMGIVVSDKDKRQLQKICKKATFHIVENGVDTDEFRPSHEVTESLALLWIGGFDHYPNKEGMHYFLERIYPLIKNKVPGVKLNIVGGGVTEKIKQYANNDSSVNAIGFVPDPLPYIQRAALFIVPLLSGGGTKLKTIEAMSVGKAIVTTPVGCEGIEGKDGQHYMITSNSNDFAEKTVRVLNDDILRENLERNAREFAERKFNWDHICEKLGKIYVNASRLQEGKRYPKNRRRADKTDGTVT